MPMLDMAKIFRWLNETATEYGYRIGTLNYMFCDDEEILRVNREFLGHDYYTDIITFDYTICNKAAADIYISLETVKSNSEEYKTDFLDELKRVIVHGLLHLLGLKDKTPQERETMEEAENNALAAYNEI